MKRDFLSLGDFGRADLDRILETATTLKRDLQAGRPTPVLAGKSLAMLFEKPSLRTRVTFDVGMAQLGGRAVYLGPSDIQLGTRESVADIARNLERWVDFIMARTFSHSTVVELGRWSHVPVVNGLSDLSHPVQVLSDALTLIERFGCLDGLRVAFIGDANNVANTWIELAETYPIEFVLAAPPGYEPDRQILAHARAAGASVSLTHDPGAAARGAHVLYTDVWTSMGQESETARRRQDFAAYQINSELLRRARPEAVVMHCLPAHRGEEITDDVIDGPQSIVFDQAENRLHTQKGILVWLNDAAATAD